MGRKKKHHLPFDNREGVAVCSRFMLKSPHYLGLSAQAKALMLLMQVHWSNTRPVDFGVREAAKKIPCTEKTAGKMFKQLEAAGFITCVEHSMFISRGGSRTRGWRLEWMPFEDRKPKHSWEKLNSEN